MPYRIKSTIKFEWVAPDDWLDAPEDWERLREHCETDEVLPVELWELWKDDLNDDNYTASKTTIQRID